MRFGDSTKEWITGFGIACLGNLALSGFNAEIGILYYLHSVLFFHYLFLLFKIISNLLICMCGAGWPYYAFLSVASGQLCWQILTVDLSSRADCNRKYVLEDCCINWLFNSPKAHLLNRSQVSTDFIGLIICWSWIIFWSLNGQYLIPWESNFEIIKNCFFFKFHF